MPFGLPARDEANWDTKLNDSINAVKATADAAQPAATLDAGVTAVDANAASTFRVQQDARQAAPKWAAGQAVAVGTTRQAPDGSWIKSTAARTTGALFTTTPLATPVLAAPTAAATGGSIAAGTTYFYKATALNALGETLGSAEVSKAIAAPLATPVNAAFTTATTGGTLAAGTYSYRVSATNALGETLASTATTQVIPAALAAPVLAAPTTATTGGTLAASTYYYKITATNALGETVGSNEVSQVTTGTTSTVGLSWAAVTGATGYKVYRATTAGGQSTSPALVATLGAVTSYTDTGTAASAGAVPATNTTATATNTVTVNWGAVTGATGYKVYGRTAAGELLMASVGAVTTWTDTGAATPAGALPASNTTATNTNTVGLSWAAITGATGYKIYRATVSGGQSTSPALLASVGAVTTYTDTGTAVTAGAVPAADTTTEQAFWTTVLGTSGTMEQVALAATFGRGVSVKDPQFGAIGNGVANDTAALNAATANGGTVYVPAGTYLCDGWVISKKTHLIFEAGAVLKQRVAPSLSGGIGSLLRFTTGSDGSTIENARLDGNRGALGATYVPGTFWIGLRIEYVDNVTVIGGEFYNHIGHALYVTGLTDNSPAKGILVRDVYVHDCAQVICVVACRDSRIENIRAKDISNAGYLVYQHAYEFRLISRFDVDGLYLDGFTPDINGQDNLSLGLDCSRADNDCSFSNIHFTGYQGTGHLGLGAAFTGAKNLHLKDFIITNFHAGLQLATVQESTASGITIDNAYKSSNTYGLSIEGAGYVAGLVIPDAHYNAQTSNVVISDSVVKRSDVGVTSTARDIEFRNVTSIGNNQYGFLIKSNADNAPSFPGQTAPRADNVALVGCHASGNGYSGLYAAANTDVTVIGGNYLNNGQNAAAPDRDGIHSEGTTNDIAVLSSPGVYDDQTWTKTAGGSILPGTYAGPVSMLMLDTSGMFVGQKVTISNIGGPGVHATVKITDIIGDAVVFDYTGTVSDSGNLVALTGTVASTASTITGTGTTFTTQILGPSYVKVGGAYPIVRKVLSDTSASITGGSVVAAGATASRVAFTVTAIRSQQTGVLLASTFASAYIDRIVARSNVAKSMDFLYASASAVLPGSILTLSANAVSIAGSSSPALIYNIPPGFRVIGTKVQVTTAISGGGATNYDLKLYDNGVLKETYATGQSLAVGTSQSYAAGTQINPGSGTLFMFVNGGTPTAGVVNAEVAIERVGV